MDSHTLRRTPALLTSAMLLASLWTVTVSAPASAQPLTCGGVPVTIPGTPGPDELEGTPDPDVIHGLGGDDVIDGLGGDDIICGGGGRDFIFGGSGEDLIFGGGAKDSIFGGGGSDDICGDGGNDQIDGGSDSDSIAGGPGKDEIYGSGGDDFLYGYRNGLCTKRGSDRRDIIKGQGGDDTIKGGPGPDILQGNKHNDTIRGQRGNDRINGGPADDDCLQNAGRGPVRKCERADLKVRVIGPSSPSVEDFPFTVRVKNRGPDATRYSLVVGEDSDNARCNFPEEDQRESFDRLAPGAVRTRAYQMDCTLFAGSSTVKLYATVDAAARDPRQGNDQDETGSIQLQ